MPPYRQLHVACCMLTFMRVSTKKGTAPALGTSQYHISYGYGYGSLCLCKRYRYSRLCIGHRIIIIG
eukprot:scaffold361713_cov71-Attheya_sp.AAC.1